MPNLGSLWFRVGLEPFARVCALWRHPWFRVGVNRDNGRENGNYRDYKGLCRGYIGILGDYIGIRDEGSRFREYGLGLGLFRVQGWTNLDGITSAQHPEDGFFNTYAEVLYFGYCPHSLTVGYDLYCNYIIALKNIPITDWN